MKDLSLRNGPEEQRRSEIRRVRFLLALPLFVLLLSLLLASSIFFFTGKYADANVFPLALVLLGVVIIFFGAFYDFGANKYLEGIFITGARLREDDITNINREQLIMTSIYAGIGLLFIVSGIILNYVFAIFL